MERDTLNTLFAISELMQRDMNRSFAGTPLTEARVAVLWTLQMQGPSTQQSVAAALGVSAKNVSTLVDALEAAGYLRRAPHATDRRAFLLTLTDTAAVLMATMEREHGELAATLLAAVEPEDRPALERGIDAIAARLEALVTESTSTDPGTTP